MSKKTTVPISNGLFTPKHCKQIGPALWVFEILIDLVTEEYVEDGERWGKILGGSPISAEIFRQKIGIHPETAKEHIRRLKTHGYIRARQTHRGYVIDVRKSIKWLMREQGAQQGPSNQQIAAELVNVFHTIPGIKAQDRDFGIMGNLLKDYGPELVTYYIARLKQAIQDYQIDDPRAWLIGTLKKVGKKDGTLATTPRERDEAKRLAKADCPHCRGSGIQVHMMGNVALPTGMKCPCWYHPTKT